MKLDEPCGHSEPQAADQLHGVCIWCWRDRAGALKRERDEARAMLRECRGELQVIASYADEPYVNVGMRVTAKAYRAVIARIDAHLDAETDRGVAFQSAATPQLEVQGGAAGEGEGR